MCRLCVEPVGVGVVVPEPDHSRYYPLIIPLTRNPPSDFEDIVCDLEYAPLSSPLSPKSRDRHIIPNPDACGDGQHCGTPPKRIVVKTQRGSPGLADSWGSGTSPTDKPKLSPPERAKVKDAPEFDFLSDLKKLKEEAFKKLKSFSPSDLEPLENPRESSLCSASPNSRSPSKGSKGRDPLRFETASIWDEPELVK